jgi:hypothetical protein
MNRETYERILLPLDAYLKLIGVGGCNLLITQTAILAVHKHTIQ